MLISIFYSIISVKPNEKLFHLKKCFKSVKNHYKNKLYEVRISKCIIIDHYDLCEFWL